MANRCEWCVNPNADDADRPEDLCDPHAAEFEGVTVDQLDRRERDQYAEWADATFG